MRHVETEVVSFNELLLVNGFLLHMINILDEIIYSVLKVRGGAFLEFVCIRFGEKDRIS